MSVQVIHLPVRESHSTTFGGGLTLESNARCEALTLSTILDHLGKNFFCAQVTFSEFACGSFVTRIVPEDFIHSPSSLVHRREREKPNTGRKIIRKSCVRSRAGRLRDRAPEFCHRIPDEALILRDGPDALMKVNRRLSMLCQQLPIASAIIWFDICRQYESC
jgi:hypothetical protein